MDELQEAWQEQVAIQQEARRERILWIWTWVAVAVFAAAFLWWTVLSFTRG